MICASSDAELIDLDHLWIVDSSSSTAAAGPSDAGPAPAESPAGVVAVELRADQEDELDLVDDDDARLLARSVLERGGGDFVAGFEVRGEPVDVMWPDARVGIAADGAPVEFDGYDVRPADGWTVEELLASISEDS